MTALSPHPTLAGRWTIEREGSTVGFAIKHLGVATVHGRFTAFDGTVGFDAGGALSTEGTVRVDSIATGDAKRDGILQNEEFFDAEAFPTIAFHGVATRQLSRGRLGKTVKLELSVRARRAGSR